jgi:hypothetical protein
MCIYVLSAIFAFKEGTLLLHKRQLGTEWFLFSYPKRRSQPAADQPHTDCLCVSLRLDNQIAGLASITPAIEPITYVVRVRAAYF